jgi:hypothetical protein
MVCHGQSVLALGSDLRMGWKIHLPHWRTSLWGGEKLLYAGLLTANLPRLLGRIAASQRNEEWMINQAL